MSLARHLQKGLFQSSPETDPRNKPGSSLGLTSIGSHKDRKFTWAADILNSWALRREVKVVFVIIKRDLSVQQN